MLALALLLLAAALPGLGAGLETRIAELERASPAARRGFWGLQVMDLETGKILYQRNPGKLFVPASNLKLFTAALALFRLGPDYRFHTRILAVEPPDEDGVVRGDVYFIGGGDPTLSARKFPYEPGPVRGDPLAALAELADQVAARGVRRIEGDIVGDDSIYVWEPYPQGWDQDDTAWEYGAPVSALTLHDGAFRLSVIAGAKPGAPGRVILRPPLEYYTIHNHVTTVARGASRIWVEWPLGSREIHVWGKVRPRAGRARLLAVRDPAHYAAWALARALRERGITVTGRVRTRHRWMHEVEDFKHGRGAEPREGFALAERRSPPLYEILEYAHKESRNLDMELIARQIALERRGIGSRAAALEEMKEFLAEIGIPEDEYRFFDSSGLSSLNLVAPRAIVKLLSFMYLSRERDGWLGLMAVGGSDGTLEHRFRRRPLRGRVLAKTGTLTGVSALSGYLELEPGRMLAFSMLLNNYGTQTAPARKFIDQVVGLFLERR